MDKKTARALEIFKELLVEIHIPTKTTDKNLHEDSEKAYELAFDVVHTVLEGRQDIGEDEPKDCDEAGPKGYALVEELKEIISDLVEDNDDIGIDNALRSLAERANSVCGNMRRYAESEEEGEEEGESKSKGIKVPGRR